MAANVPTSPDGPPPAEDDNDADEAGATDGADGADGAATPSPSASSALSASESSLPPPPADGESPPPLDYGALAARIAALPTTDEVGGAVHRFDTIEPADAAGYAAAYRSAASLFLLLVSGKGGGAGGGPVGGRGGGVDGSDVYAVAVGGDRVALVFATRTDAVMYGRLMLGKAGSSGYRRVRVAELEPDDVERLCESGGMRLGFVPAGALSVQRPGADGGEGAVVEETTDEDVLADGDMDAEEAAAMREKLNKLFQSGGGSL